MAAMVSMVKGWPLKECSFPRTASTTELGSTRAPSTAKLWISG